MFALFGCRSKRKDKDKEKGGKKNKHSKRSGAPMEVSTEELMVRPYCTTTAGLFAPPPPCPPALRALFLYARMSKLKFGAVLCLVHSRRERFQVTRRSDSGRARARGRAVSLTST